jgi:hypothetical protein
MMSCQNWTVSEDGFDLILSSTQMTSTFINKYLGKILAERVVIAEDFT